MLTDESVMSWGKYRGEKMINIPAAYLISLKNDGYAKGDLLAYIDDNWDELHNEIEIKDEQWVQ